MAEDSADPGDRGRLTFRDKAIEHIAVAAMLDVPGVHHERTGFRRLTGNELPGADVQIAGDRVSARLDIAVEWGRPLAATARAVREHVALALRDHGGLVVDALTVHIATITTDPSDRLTRRVS